MFKRPFRFGRFMLLWSTFECILEGFFGHYEFLTATVAGGFMRTFPFFFRTKGPYSSVFYSRSWSQKYWARGALKGRRTSKFFRRMLPKFVGGCMQMGLFEGAILLIMSLMPEDDAKHFVDPFFNPDFNPISTSEKESYLLDVEFQQAYGIQPSEREETDISKKRPQHRTFIDEYLDKRGVGSRQNP